MQRCIRRRRKSIPLTQVFWFELPNLECIAAEMDMAMPRTGFQIMEYWRRSNGI